MRAYSRKAVVVRRERDRSRRSGSGSRPAGGSRGDPGSTCGRGCSSCSIGALAGEPLIERGVQVGRALAHRPHHRLRRPDGGLDDEVRELAGAQRGDVLRRYGVGDVALRQPRDEPIGRLVDLDDLDVVASARRSARAGAGGKATPRQVHPLRRRGSGGAAISRARTVTGAGAAVSRRSARWRARRCPTRPSRARPHRAARRPAPSSRARRSSAPRSRSSEATSCAATTSPSPRLSASNSNPLSRTTIGRSRSAALLARRR